MPLIEHDSNTDLTIPNEGKYAIMFHLPGHCAGCKVAVANLENKDLEDITVELINAEDNNNRPIVEKYEATTAPTVIVFENGEIVGRMNGLKDFLSNHKNLLGD